MVGQVIFSWECVSAVTVGAEIMRLSRQLDVVSSAKYSRAAQVVGLQKWSGTYLHSACIKVLRVPCPIVFQQKITIEKCWEVTKIIISRKKRSLCSAKTLWSGLFTRSANNEDLATICASSPRWITKHLNEGQRVEQGSVIVRWQWRNDTPRSFMFFLMSNNLNSITTLQFNMASTQSFKKWKHLKALCCILISKGLALKSWKRKKKSVGSLLWLVLIREEKEDL